MAHKYNQNQGDKKHPITGLIYEGVRLTHENTLLKEQNKKMLEMLMNFVLYHENQVLPDKYDSFYEMMVKVNGLIAKVDKSQV